MINQAMLMFIVGGLRYLGTTQDDGPTGLQPPGLFIISLVFDTQEN